MKCVQLSDGKIIRVSDMEAHRIVEEKKGQYIAKKYWKEKRKEDKDE